MKEDALRLGAGEVVVSYRHADEDAEACRQLFDFILDAVSANHDIGRP